MIARWQLSGARFICLLLVYWYDNAQGENIVCGVKCANALVFLRDGKNAAAAVAVAALVGNRQTILHNYLTLVRVFNFNEQIVLFYIRIQIDSFSGGIRQA